MTEVDWLDEQLNVQLKTRRDLEQMLDQLAKVATERERSRWWDDDTMLTEGATRRLCLQDIETYLTDPDGHMKEITGTG